MCSNGATGEVTLSTGCFSTESCFTRRILAVFKTGLFIHGSVDVLGDGTDKGEDTDNGVGFTDNGDVTDNGDMGSGDPMVIPVVTESALFR